MTTTSITSGQSVTRSVVFSGDVLLILSGGSAVTGTFVSVIGGAFATELVNDGGTAINTAWPRAAALPRASSRAASPPMRR